MIFVLEMDVRRHNGKRFSWRPGRFVGPWYVPWTGKRTWRVWWGFWSLSYYPSPGLHDFFDYIESGSAEWHYTGDDVPALRQHGGAREK